MLKSCLDFTCQVSVVKRLILASALLPPETPKLWEIVTSFATRSTQTNLTPDKARVFIENLRYIEPESFSLDRDLIQELHSLVGESNKVLGVILLSPNQICITCGSSLLVKADRPSQVTVYSDSEGTIFGTHYRKFCKRFRSGCKFVQHYGYYSVGESSIHYNEDWEQHKYFLSTRETAFEMALLKQLDIEILIGQLSYKQRSDIYNIKHGYDRPRKKARKGTLTSGSSEPRCTTEPRYIS